MCVSFCDQQDFLTKLLSLYIIVLNKVKLVISCVKKGATVKKGKEELRPQRQRETNKKVPAGGKGFVAVEAIFQLFSNALIDQKRAINEGPVGGRERTKAAGRGFSGRAHP